MICSFAIFILVAALSMLIRRSYARRRNFRAAVTSDQSPLAHPLAQEEGIDGFQRVGKWWRRPKEKYYRNRERTREEKKSSFWKSLMRKEKHGEVEAEPEEQIYELADSRSVDESPRHPSISERYA